MTNELTKTFFDTFGIEQKEHKECQCDYLNCPNPDIEECKECYYYKTYKFDYPQITDRILLELISICVLYGWHLCRYWNGDQNFVYENQRLKPEERFCVIDTDLKNATLILLIELVNKEGVKHQIRTLFKEG